VSQHEEHAGRADDAIEEVSIHATGRLSVFDRCHASVDAELVFLSEMSSFLMRTMSARGSL
jgi:hypothetical protein